jgi:hypothetical protein
VNTTGDTPIGPGDTVRLLTPPCWKGLEVEVSQVHRHYKEQGWYWVIFKHPEGGESALFDKYVELVKSKHE